MCINKRSIQHPFSSTVLTTKIKYDSSGKILSTVRTQPEFASCFPISSKAKVGHERSLLRTHVTCLQSVLSGFPSGLGRHIPEKMDRILSGLKTCQEFFWVCVKVEYRHLPDESVQIEVPDVSPLWRTIFFKNPCYRNVRMSWPLILAAFLLEKYF